MADQRHIIGCTVCKGSWEPCDHILAEMVRLTKRGNAASETEVANLRLMAALQNLAEAVVNFPGWRNNDRLRASLKMAQDEAAGAGFNLVFLPVRSGVGGIAGGRGSPSGAEDSE